MKRKNTYFLLYLLPLLIFFCIYYILGFSGLYGQDPHEYFRYAKALRNAFLTFEHPGDFYWAINYPLYGALVSLIVQKMDFAMMLVSMGSVIGTAVYTEKLLRLLYPEAKARYMVLAVVVLFIWTPVSIKSGYVIMADHLGAFFVIAAIYHCLCYVQTMRKRDFLLFAFLTASAVMSRYAAAVVLLIPGLVMLWKWRENKRLGELLAALLIGLICIFPHLFIRYHTVSAFLQHQMLQDWSPANIFARSMKVKDGNLSYLVPNIVYVFFGFFHPYYLAFGAALFPFLRPKKDYASRPLLWLIGFTFLCYAIFLAGVPVQCRRYLLLSFPLITVLLYPAFCRLLDWRKETWWKPIVIGGFMLAQVPFIYYFFSKFYFLNQREQTVSAYLRPLPQKHVYGMDVDVSFTSYGIGDKESHNLILEAYDHFEPNSLVIINSRTIHTQWKDRNPDKNWTFLQENCELRELERFGEMVLLETGECRE